MTLGIANNYLEEAPAFAKRPPGATPLVTVRLHGNRSGKYEVRHESGMVLEGQNIPVCRLVAVDGACVVALP